MSSDFKPHVGSFTAYLEYMQRSKSEATPAPVSPITLLEILARQPQRSMAMADLEKLSGMEPAQFRNALKSLTDAAYVTVQGPSPSVLPVKPSGLACAGIHRISTSIFVWRGVRAAILRRKVVSLLFLKWVD